MKRTLLIFLFVLLGVFCLFGCSSNNSEEDEIDTVEETPSSSLGMQEINIYTIGDDLNLTTVKVSVGKDEKITPKLITDKVIENLDNEVGIDKVEQKEDQVIITFQTSKAPITGVSAQIENDILDCIANSILDNLEECQKIIYRSSNGQYKSQNHTFELDEAYAWK